MSKKEQIKTMEKQIEEIACDKCLHYGACLFNSEYVPTPCHKYENNAGYRKASDVAREIFEEIEKTTASVYNDFMFNRDGVGMRAHYVVEFSDELDLAIAELKKKYTEEEG